MVGNSRASVKVVKDWMLPLEKYGGTTPDLSCCIFQQLPLVEKDCFCPAGKDLLEVLVYDKNKQSIKYFILILSLSVTAAVLVIASKRPDLQRCWGFCLPWFKVMPWRVLMLLFLHLSQFRTFTLKQMFWLTEGLVFTDYGRMFFLQLLQSVKSRVGFVRL